MKKKLLALLLSLSLAALLCSCGSIVVPIRVTPQAGTAQNGDTITVTVTNISDSTVTNIRVDVLFKTPQNMRYGTDSTGNFNLAAGESREFPFQKDGATTVEIDYVNCDRLVMLTPLYPINSSAFRY